MAKLAEKIPGSIFRWHDENGGLHLSQVPPPSTCRTLSCISARNGRKIPRELMELMNEKSRLLRFQLTELQNRRAAAEIKLLSVKENNQKKEKRPEKEYSNEDNETLEDRIAGCAIIGRVLAQAEEKYERTDKTAEPNRAIERIRGSARENCSEILIPSSGSKR